MLPPVMASIIPIEAVKEDKHTFRAQQLWLEAAAPLVSLLETAHKDRLDPTMLSERNKQHDHPSQVGQCDSNHFHQSDGRNSLQAFMPTSTCLVGMVCSEEPVPSCRTSTG